MSEKIKYANCWEDADLLLDTVQLPQGCNILSIASGGDNSFALLSTAPKTLYAVDTNVAQLHLCELKAAAFSALNHEDLLHFFFGSPQANDFFETIKQSLSLSCRQYWEHHENSIQKGILNAGKFERYFRFFRSKVMPLIHSKKNIQALLAEKTEQEQTDFYHQQWNTWRWRLLFRLFFSRFVLGRFGRTKAYLNQVDISVAGFIYHQAERHLQSRYCPSNYFLHYIFTGAFKPQLPFYLRKENFESIRQNLSALKLQHGRAEDFIKKTTDINYCNFSNILEYMNGEAFSAFHQILLQYLPENAVISYWNLMVDRVFSDAFPGTFSRHHPEQDHKSDKGFFYKRFVTDIKK